MFIVVFTAIFSYIPKKINIKVNINTNIDICVTKVQVVQVELVKTRLNFLSS